MVDVTTHIELLCPIDKVIQYATDPDNAPRWYANIQSVAWVSPPPLAVGSKIRFRANFLGKQLAYTYEVVAWDQQQFVMRTAEGPFPMETIYTWEQKTNDLTIMYLRNRGELSGFARLVKPFMEWMMKQANKKDLKQLKMILEKKISIAPWLIMKPLPTGSGKH